MGKCLGRGTKILMFNGKVKNVEEIKINEQLIGPDSKPRKIISLAYGKGEMYWVRQKKGIDYRVNKDHILSLKRSRNEGGYKKGDIINISIEEYIKKSNKFKSNYKGYKTSVEFQETKLCIPHYLLGVWLGDGSSASARITNPDEEIINYLQRIAPLFGQELYTYKSKDKCLTHNIRNPGRRLKAGYTRDDSFQTQLKNIGVLGDKHIPHKYLINSTKNRLLLLAGLIDTDGYYSDDTHCYEIVQKSETLAKQIKFISDSLGFKTSFTKKSARIKERGFTCEVFRVRISGNIEIIPVKVKRKKARKRISNVDWRVTGITVEYDKVDEYFGFELTGDGLFLFKDMTVTHNTALKDNMAVNIAREGTPVGIFNLEMTEEQAGIRHIADIGEIPIKSLRSGRMIREVYRKAVTAAGQLANLPIYYCFQSPMTIFDIWDHAEDMVETKGVGIIFVDYLTLIEGVNRRHERERIVSEISRNFKHMAKSLRIPVVLLAQLNRSCEARTDKRPMLSDLRESGAVEQDADNVLFIYRDDYYDSKSKSKGISELIYAKARQFRVGKKELAWKEEEASFRNLSKYGDDYPGLY
ncbi:MAG TPA: hypothetical protein ENH82_15095 [bacterium]|nr:hypothetical protein [bacterium]